MTGPALPLSSVLSGLSTALDITDGHPPGHAARTCVIAMRMARALDLDDETASDVFHAALLKDAGCSANAEGVFRLFGGPDEHLTKRAAWHQDSRKLHVKLRYLFDWVEPGGPVLVRMNRFLRLVFAGSTAWRELFAIRCERGAAIARAISFSEGTARAVLTTHEHWDGGGRPSGLRGHSIPLAARIINLAQIVEIFRDLAGPARALEIARERSGRWFEPALVDCLARVASPELWATVASDDPTAAVAAVEPRAALIEATDARLDQVASAFAWIIDAKCTFTFEHSLRVGAIARAVAERLAFTAAALTRLRRAALLHDLGKLAVPQAVLDKPGPLTPEEWQVMRTHPRFTRQILQRVPVFAELADDAANHHERLDGTGYDRGLHREQLTATARVLAVADVADALLSARPYRAAMPLDRVLSVISADAGRTLCADAVAAFRDAIEHDACPLPAAV